MEDETAADGVSGELEPWDKGIDREHAREKVGQNPRG